MTSLVFTSQGTLICLWESVLGELAFFLVATEIPASVEGA